MPSPPWQDHLTRPIAPAHSFPACRWADFTSNLQGRHRSLLSIRSAFAVQSARYTASFGSQAQGVSWGRSSYGNTAAWTQTVKEWCKRFTADSVLLMPTKSADQRRPPDRPGNHRWSGRMARAISIVRQDPKSHSISASCSQMQFWRCKAPFEQYNLGASEPILRSGPTRSTP